ncbi:MAG TPA: hypothetical protein VMG12_09650 [Polyangiaceae bacterium]|nr:hypothetical protein [Polyangiaceae bacterium]
MSDHPQCDAFVREILSEFPAFRIVPKAGNAFSRAIDAALRLITFGAQRHYMTRYHTVIGDTLYVPELWKDMTDVARVILLRHERVHLRQRRRYGMVPFALLYLLPIFPLGLAWFRARFEWEAYRETLRATADLRGSSALDDPLLRREIVRRFVSGDYGWMWPFSRTIERWFDQAVNEIRSELASVTASPPNAGSADSSSNSQSH